MEVSLNVAIAPAVLSISLDIANMADVGYVSSLNRPIFINVSHNRQERSLTVAEKYFFVEFKQKVWKFQSSDVMACQNKAHPHVPLKLPV